MAPDVFDAIAVKEAEVIKLKQKITSGTTKVIQIIGEMSPSFPNKTLGFAMILNGSENKLYIRTGKSGTYLDDEFLDKEIVMILDRNTGGVTMGSTVGAFTPNKLTTTEKNALTPTTGMMVYDTTLDKLCVYTGSAWETITSA